MNFTDWIQIIVTLLALVFLAPLMGKYMFQVYEGKLPKAAKLLSPLEKLSASVIGKTQYTQEMSWKEYAFALLFFNALGLLFVFLLQLMQTWLPFNPQALAPISWHLALNTAVSFVTNTNWQSYGGESTMSYLVQFLALATQNFLSAATGMAVAVALCRGFARQNQNSIGNFWTDLSKSIIYILIPFSIILALVLVSSGVVQTFAGAQHVTTLSGAEQVIPLGPAASQIAIKQLGTNGGGFFNTNSAHPFENPTPFSNWLQLIAILLIPAGFAYFYGHAVKNLKQGRMVFGVMLTLLVAGLGVSLWSEFHANAALGGLRSFEGKEIRIGNTGSILWSTFTTAASNGAVNAMHSSLTPIASGVALLNMMLGEIIFGGVGSGLYGMVIFIILTIFISGLMVGRTPEYLGKKIEAREMQMSVLAILLPSACVLIGTALAILLPAGLSSLSAKGPHAFSEMLYAFTSAANNNGSAFAGLNANTPFYNLALAIAMLMGRFGVIIPVLAIAGNFAAKTYAPPTAGTFKTDGFIFPVLLMGVIIIVGGLTFFPALILGPGIEHLLMNLGRTF